MCFKVILPLITLVSFQSLTANENEKKENWRTLDFVNDLDLGLIGVSGSEHFKVNLDKVE